MAAQSPLQRIKKAIRQVNRMTNNLYYTKEELRLHARDLRMKNLLQKGHASSREILIADFGTENIKSLDIKSYPELENRYLPLTETEYYKNASPKEKERELKNTLGKGGADDKIYIHPKNMGENIKPDRSVSSTISHEHIHRMQGYERDSGWDSTYSSNKMNDVRALVKLRTLWTLNIGDKTQFKINNPRDWLKREFQKAAQNHTEKKAHKDYERGVKDYFSKEVEIQARLHEVMAQGYNCWGKMPTNKTELYAAMTHLGFSVPDKIKHRLTDTPQGRQALKDFYLSDQQKKNISVRSEIEELNYVKKFAALPEKKAMLFETIYPSLYGNLLEMYGDGPGRARMGLGANPRPAKDLMYAFHNTPDVFHNDEKLAVMVNAVPAEHANELINRLIDDSINNPRGRIRTQALTNKIIGSLLDREDVINHLNKTTTVDNSSPERFAMTIPCICAAVRTGRSDIINTLMDKGYNPLVEIKSSGTPATPTKNTYPAITGMVNIYERREQSLNDPSLTDDMREDLTSFINTLEKGLQAIANHPASSTYQKLSGTFNDHAGHASARELLADVGIYPQSSPLDVENKQDEAAKDNMGTGEKSRSSVTLPPI